MKFYDAVGFAESVERPEGSGIWEDVITERKLRGEVLRNTRAQREADQVNADQTISNRFSLMASSFAMENYDSIRYVTWKGRRYLATNVEVEPPRLYLTPGGVYNGPTPEAPRPVEDSGS